MFEILSEKEKKKCTHTIKNKNKKLKNLSLFCSSINTKYQIKKLKKKKKKKTQHCLHNPPHTDNQQSKPRAVESNFCILIHHLIRRIVNWRRSVCFVRRKWCLLRLLRARLWRIRGHIWSQSQRWSINLSLKQLFRQQDLVDSVDRDWLLIDQSSGDLRRHNLRLQRHVHSVILHREIEL